MAANKKKPAEYGRFEQLTKKLLNIPKTDLNKQVKAYESNKAKRAAKKESR